MSESLSSCVSCPLVKSCSLGLAVLFGQTRSLGVGLWVGSMMTDRIGD